MKLDPANLSFRAMIAADVAQLRRWLAEPHVSEWFTPDHGDALIEAVTTADSRIRVSVVSYETTPIGMIAWERLADFPDVMKLYGVEDEGAINCDVFIGERSYVGCGLGGPIVERFTRDLASRDPRITTCIIDPEVDNQGAIRAYSKVGFRWLRNAPDGEGKTVYLMELRLAP